MHVAKHVMQTGVLDLDLPDYGPRLLVVSSLQSALGNIRTCSFPVHYLVFVYSYVRY